MSCYMIGQVDFYTAQLGNGFQLLVASRVTRHGEYFIISCHTPVLLYYLSGNIQQSEEFLSYIKPETALISCGAGNSYGHPHTETLKRLSGIKAKVYRTDESGEIAVRVREGSYKIEMFKELKG